ncbi:DNA repair protein RadC [Zoogloea sp.]|uniref:RadC family protein n=1 Tax=Zoogloea sp. TaxID=49181 RepID=UPI002630F4D1|nr:DNA repair protein RadC [Zoogloea sp.]MDD3354633.1 DNA repair protein RadC [Zoogloea sp.]
MTPTPIRHLPDADLLRLVLGNEGAATLTDLPLADVFRFDAGTPALQEGIAHYGPLRPLAAAVELMARALSRILANRDCLAEPASVRKLLQLRLGGLPHEVFAVLLLDAQNRLIDCVELFRGTLTQTSVYPREVVKLALQRNAGAVIFAHNHPSGVTEPSQADEALTRTLKQALALVDVRVLDHFIVGGGDPLSFAERGLL